MEGKEEGSAGSQAFGTKGHTLFRYWLLSLSYHICAIQEG